MGTELILHQTAAAIRKHLPALDQQYDYQRKLSALKQYAKNKDFYVAQLEAEAAIALTLPQAMKQGDVTANGNHYAMSKVDIELPNAAVNRWRQVADIPARERSKYYATEQRPTRKGLLRWHENQSLVVPTKPDTKHVQVLLADPPWQYDFSETDTRAVENQYPTATPEDIGTHLKAWGPGLAKDCVLFLWATAPKLPEALTVMEAWGFTYRTSAVWDKERVGMGYWFRGQHELLLVGVRGKFRPPDADLRVSSVFRERRANKHSKKPVCVYEALEKMFPTATKFEMYQRAARRGWLGGGNESGSA